MPDEALELLTERQDRHEHAVGYQYYAAAAAMADAVALSLAQEAPKFQSPGDFRSAVDWITCHCSDRMDVRRSAAEHTPGSISVIAH